MSRPDISIIGAGLGGLTAAIALVQRGFAVQVLEQAGQLREVGAGLTVSRSATSALNDLGLGDAVMARASFTQRMAFAHYQSGRMLAGEVDTSDGLTPGQGAIHIHRADLHALLAQRFEELAPGCLHLGHRLTDFTDATGPVRARFANGHQVASDLLIGADGIRSVVRDKLWGASTPRFTGQVAYRFMLAGADAAPFLADHGRAAVFLGPGRVFNRYTLRGGALVNCVGITRNDAWQGEGWSQPAEREEMLALYAGWHPDVLKLMALAPADTLIKWALFDRPPLPGWQRGRSTLIGDAAHPMLPFLGLGAAMAIEDGIVLARSLERFPDRRGLTLYEQTRRGRVEKIANLSRLQGEISQARDPDHYDASNAPAQDKSLQDYDPVTTPLLDEAVA